MKRNVRKSLSIFMAATLLLGLMITGAAADDELYTDVDSSHYAYAAINQMAELGLLLGTGDGKFSPNESLNRATFLTALWRLAGKPESEIEDFPFEDVPETAWYYDAVCWAFEVGITKGTSETEFSPLQVLKRQDMVVLLYNFVTIMDEQDVPEEDLDTKDLDEEEPEEEDLDEEEPEEEDSDGEELDMEALEGFEDYESISNYALKAMIWAVENEIIRGLPGNLIGPAGASTRAQAAVVLSRFIATIEGGETEEPGEDGEDGEEEGEGEGDGESEPDA